MTEERRRLKDFIEKHIPFYSLKKAGFFPAGTRRTDYEKIAERVCRFFGYKTIYEYARYDFITTAETETAVYGKNRDMVNEQGKLVKGEGFHLSLIQTSFQCPVCECKQDADDHAAYRRAKYPVVTIKCKGCKRPLVLDSGIGGELTVCEK